MSSDESEIEPFPASESEYEPDSFDETDSSSEGRIFSLYVHKQKHS